VLNACGGPFTALAHFDPGPCLVRQLPQIYANRSKTMTDAGSQESDHQRTNWRKSDTFSVTVGAVDSDLDSLTRKRSAVPKSALATHILA
jgi:hypothetical protein